MLSPTYFTPNIGFDRGCVLTAFGNSSALASADYQTGYVYTYDTFDGLVTLGSSLPQIFGSWVYNLTAGLLPTQLPGGGIQFVGGGTGGINWTNNAFSGSFGLEVQGINGGIIGFAPTITGLSYTVTGGEDLTLYIKILDYIPDQIELQFYVQSLGWQKPIWWGTTDLFNLANSVQIGTLVGSSLSTWIALNFNANNLGLIAGQIVTGLAWGVYKNDGISSVVFSDTLNSDVTPAVMLVSGVGFIDAVPDPTNGFYILSHYGNMYHVHSVANSSPTYTALASTPSIAYTGISSIPSDPSNFGPYIMGDDGTVYKYSSGSNSFSSFAAPSSGLTAPARWLYNDSSNFYSSFPADDDIGILNIGSTTWSTRSVPFGASWDTFYYSQDLSTTIVGGSDTRSFSSPGIVGMVYSNSAVFTNLTQMISINSPNSINFWDYTDGGWARGATQATMAGAGNPTNIAISADASHILISNTSANIIQQLTLQAGNIWTSANLTGVVAPGSIAISPDGIHALVCQTSQNIVTILTRSINTWQVSYSLSVSNPNSVSILPNGQAAIVGTATGVTILTFSGLVWEKLIPPIALASSPIVCVDSQNSQNPYFYAAVCPLGTATTVYVIDAQGNIVAQQLILFGPLSNIIVINSQIVMTTNIGSVVVGYYIGGNLVLNASNATVPIGNTIFCWVPGPTDYMNLLLVGGPNTFQELQNLSPTEFVSTTDSKVAVWSGGGWIETDLQNRNITTSITTDPSGNIYVSTVDDNIYKITSSLIDINYPSLVTPISGQFQGVPIGISKMVWWNGNLYAASSLTGGIIKIAGT